MLRSCRGYVGLRPSRIEGPPLGPCWAGWAHLGPILGLSWGLCWLYVGLCWLYVGPMLAYVSHILAYVGPVLALCWPYVGLCWPHVGPSWGLCWGYVGDMWDHLCWKTSKMPIFPSRIRPGNQEPRKNHGFALSPTKKSACPSTQNTVQNDVFVTSHARNTVKYGDFSRWGLAPCWRTEPACGLQLTVPNLAQETSSQKLLAFLLRAPCCL